MSRRPTSLRLPIHRVQRWRLLAARSPVSATRALVVLVFIIVLLLVIAIATATARFSYEDINDIAAKEAGISMTQGTNGTNVTKKRRQNQFTIEIIGDGTSTAFHCELKPRSTEPPPTREGQYMIHVYGWPHSGAGYMRQTLTDAINASLGSVSTQYGKSVPDILVIQDEGQFMQTVSVRKLEIY